MICSMTGFAAVQRETAAGTLMVELRAVNHRYLELHLKLDDALRACEPLLRERLAAGLGRGKVECRASLLAASGNQATELDEAMLERLAALSQQVQQRFPESRPLSVADILRWPGVMAGPELPSAQKLESEVLSALDQALGDMAETRRREGAKLAAVIADRATQMEVLVAGVKPLLPQLIQSYQARLANRLQEVLQSADETRLHQELALYAQKIDVDEELERLTAHLQEVKRVLAAGGPVGKRLDFLMQELNREANTLGSKSVSTETTQVSMALKVLIEQMREQIQNIE